MSQTNPQDFMNQFNQFNGDTQKMFEPWTKLNQAFLKNAEMMTEFSLNTIRSYSEMGLENMRQVAGIDSAESAKDFGEKQTEMLNNISQKMLADAQRMSELGSNMQEEIMKVMNEVQGEAGKKMQDSMQKTADQATKKGQEYANNVNKMAEQFTEKASDAVKAATKTVTANNKTASDSNANSTNNSVTGKSTTK